MLDAGRERSQEPLRDQYATDDGRLRADQVTGNDARGERVMMMRRTKWPITDNKLNNCQN